MRRRRRSEDMMKIRTAPPAVCGDPRALRSEHAPLPREGISPEER